MAARRSIGLWCWRGVAATMLLVLGVPGEGAAAYVWRDDFSRYQPGSDAAPEWFAHTVGWAVQDGAYRCTDPGPSFAVADSAPAGRMVSVEAALHITGKTTDNWKVAGVAVYADPQNYWHLALVEAPDQQGGKHLVELSEMLDGVWLAHSAAATRLSVTQDFRASQAWAYERTYRLRLTLGLGRVGGLILDSDGVVIARLGYRLDNRAVTWGRPALDSGGFQSAFDDVSVQVQETMNQPKPEFPRYRDRTGAPPLPKAPGFFRVMERGGVWWLLDPNGREFFALGTDHVNWNVHWCEQLGYAPYHRNLVEKYEGDEARWARTTRRRLEAWGFNALGVNSSPSVQHQGLAHMESLGMGQAFAALENIVPQVHWTGFPDVFSERWAAHCDKMARARCAPQRDDPWLVGYFIDNELEWFGKTWREGGMVGEVWKKPPDHPAKQAWIALLRERHQTIEAFNEAWGAQFPDFEALAAATEPVVSQTEAARDDRREFVRMAAERYFREASAAIRRHDPNHLVLGCRFAGRAPDIWDIAGQHCDVISVNAYRQVDLDAGEVVGFAQDLRDWHEQSGRPLMITEWSFPALDSGLPCKHGAGQRFDTQAQRAKAFEIFQTLLLRTPFMVGSNFFMWVDEPALGISSTFPEDSNYGLVNERDVPYAELTETATRIHAQWRALHEESPAPPAEAEQPPAYTPGAPWALDASSERLPLLVWGDTTSGGPVVVAARIRDLWPDQDPQGIMARAAALIDQTEGEPQPCEFQIDSLSGEPEIVMRVAPRGPRTCFLYLAPEPAARQPATGMLKREEARILLANGPLTLTKIKGSSQIFDLIEYEGAAIGRFMPLLWQRSGGDQWSGDHRVAVAAAEEGPLRAVMDFIAERADEEMGYRAAYRITLPAGKPWFASRCLWIENTGTKPWGLEAYYHYAVSALGGEAGDDVVGGPGVPSYYLPFGAWTDPGLGLSYGVISPRLGDFETNFWKDERGGQHPDFARRLGVVLQPGQRFDAPQPEAIVFAARGSLREAAAAIGQEVRASRAVRLAGLPAERR